MRGGIFRVIATLAVAALLALGAAACGEDSDTTTATSEDTIAREGGSSGAEDQNGSAPSQASKKGSGGNGSEGGSGKPQVEPAPLQVSGGGSGQFRVKGGDNSIQNWGEEDEDELAAAAEAVHDFYVARANEEWEAACSHLADSLVEQLLQLAKQQGKADCATILEALTPPLSPSVRRETTVVDAGSLRIGEENSFLIYRGFEGTVYAMPLQNEGGAWKLTLLSPSPLG